MVSFQPIFRPILASFTYSEIPIFSQTIQYSYKYLFLPLKLRIINCTYTSYIQNKY